MMNTTFSHWLGLRLLVLGGLLALLAGGLALGALWMTAMERAAVLPSPPTQTPTEMAWLPTLVIPTIALVSPSPLPTEISPSAAPSPTWWPTPTPPSVLYPTCTPPAGWLPYRVRAGDTLYSLAWRAGTSPLVIQRANCLIGEALQVGRILYLPPQFFATPTPVPCGPPPGWVRYIVQPGDTLWNLSIRVGVSVETIRWANCMSGYTLRVGQPLYLPIYPPPLTATPTRTPTATRTPSPTSTGTPTGTATPTPTGTIIPTPTGTPTPSPTPETPTPTESPIPTPSPTPETPTPPTSPTPIPSPTPETPTPVLPTETPVPSPTAAPPAP